MLGGLALAAMSSEALAQCSDDGTVAAGSVITCSGAQITRVGQGPGADGVILTVRDGGSILVHNDNAISLGDGASIVLGSSGPAAGGLASNPTVTVRSTTDGSASGGRYADGSNTVDLGSNSRILINRNAVVAASGSQTISEAINLYGAGNTITNYGLIQGGPSSAIFFQNVNTTAASPRNVVDNYGVIQLLPVGSVNPITGGQAVASYNNVGIDFINQSGAKVIGDLVFQGGDDRVTLNPGSSISGDFDGGAGFNLLTLKASAASADTFTGVLKNFDALDKTGAGSWTLTGAIGNNGGASPLAVQVIGGTLVLTGNNTAFNGSVVINPGSSPAVAGPDASATLQARAQSLPPLITDHGLLLLNQVSPDGVQSADGVYAGAVSGTGALTKVGGGTTVLTGINPFSGATAVNAGVLAVGDAAHPAAALSGHGAVSVQAGAVLGGYGSVGGDVTNDGVVSAGNAVPLFAGGAAGRFTINGSLQNRGSIALRGGSIGNTLLVKGNYGGAGVLKVNTLLNAGGPIASQSTDRLLILGAAAGSTTVQVQGSGVGAATGSAASQGISLIQVAGASSVGAFTLAGGYVSNGTPYQYRLYAFGPGSPNGAASAAQTLVGNPAGHWDYRLQSVFVTPGGPIPPPVVTPPVVTPPVVTPQISPAAGDPDVPIVTEAEATPVLPAGSRPVLTPQVPAYITTPTALFNSGFQSLDSLHRRLGEIRSEGVSGVGQAGETFARGLGGRFNYVSDRTFPQNGFNSQQDYSAVQFGANRTAIDNAAGNLRAGLAVTIGRSWFKPQAVDGDSQGLFNTGSLAGIVTWQSRAGWYIDAIVSGGLFDGKISTAARGQTLGMNGTSLAFSAEAGYPISTGWRGVILEPQAQLVYQRLDFTRRVDVDGIDVDMGGLGQGVMRAGFRLIKPMTARDGSLFTPYLKFNVLQGIAGGDSIRVGGFPFDTGQFGSAAQAGVGATGALSKRLSIYGEAAWQQNFQGGGSRGWALNGGLRYAF
jgi:outer membrane autotransporter protein